jgi:hypothetical protein
VHDARLSTLGEERSVSGGYDALAPRYAMAMQSAIENFLDRGDLGELHDASMHVGPQIFTSKRPWHTDCSPEACASLANFSSEL